MHDYVLVNMYNNTYSFTGIENMIMINMIKYVNFLLIEKHSFLLQAIHLIRAVSVLLKFSAEEQKLIRETLEWKMSWFGSRPSTGGGQRAKFIPPSF